MMSASSGGFDRPGGLEGWVDGATHTRMAWLCSLCNRQVLMDERDSHTAFTDSA
jgi:hypothetical protein